MSREPRDSTCYVDLSGERYDGGTAIADGSVASDGSFSTPEATMDGGESRRHKSSD